MEEKPRHSAYVEICLSLNSDVIRHLHDNEPTRAAIYAGKLSERLRELEASIWAEHESLDAESKQKQT